MGRWPVRAVVSCIKLEHLQRGLSTTKMYSTIWCHVVRQLSTLVSRPFPLKSKVSSSDVLCRQCAAVSVTYLGYPAIHPEKYQVRGPNAAKTYPAGQGSPISEVPLLSISWSRLFSCSGLCENPGHPIPKQEWRQPSRRQSNGVALKAIRRTVPLLHQKPLLQSLTWLVHWFQ